MTHPADRAHRTLDPIDRLILDELGRDARLSVRALADRIHVSRTSAHTRMQNLIASGVITGFRTDVDRASIGLPMSALVALRVVDGQAQQVADHASKVPFVERVQLLSGDVDVLLTVSAPDHERLAREVHRRIQTMPGVISVRIQIIVGEVNGCPPVDSVADWR